MSGRYSRQKGYRIEHELVKLLKSYNINSRRVPLSGGSWLKGDIIIEYNNKTYVCEVKGGSNKFKSIYDKFLTYRDTTNKSCVTISNYILCDIPTFVKLLNNEINIINDINDTLNLTRVKMINNYINNKDVLFIKRDRKEYLVIFRKQLFNQGE
jgi:hypothetical protein